MKRVKRFEWNNIMFSLVVDVAILSVTISRDSSPVLLVFIKARSLRSLTSSQAVTLSMFRGKPSSRNMSAFELLKALLMRPTVISAGTKLPLEILELMIFAVGELVFLSARRRSPAEKKAWLEEIGVGVGVGVEVGGIRRSHTVPLPAPGPPRTNITCFLPSEVLGFWEDDRRLDTVIYVITPEKKSIFPSGQRDMVICVFQLKNLRKSKVFSIPHLKRKRAIA